MTSCIPVAHGLDKALDLQALHNSQVEAKALQLVEGLLNTLCSPSQMHLEVRPEIRTTEAVPWH